MKDLERLSIDQRKITKTFLNNARNFIIIFILFIVVVVMSTDIRFVVTTDLAALSLDFFLLLFCSYTMYVCCADNGSKAGNASELYKNASERFATLKKRIVESSHHTRMREFCTHYVTEDLRDTRMQYLAIAGIKYEDYIEKYSKLDKASIKAAPGFSRVQKAALKKANKVRPVKLTPEMVLRQGRSPHRRSPLEITPKTKKTFVFSAKLVEMSVISACMSVIALDVIMEPTWVVFATVCLKLASVIISGFGGYKAGYDNIALDTANYLESQSDLMEQAIQYIEANPTTETTTTTEAITEATTEATTEISLVETTTTNE